MQWIKKVSAPYFLMYKSDLINFQIDGCLLFFISELFSFLEKSKTSNLNEKKLVKKNPVLYKKITPFHILSIYFWIQISFDYLCQN